MEARLVLLYRGVQAEPSHRDEALLGREHVLRRAARAQRATAVCVRDDFRFPSACALFWSSGGLCFLCMYSSGVVCARDAFRPRTACVALCCCCVLRLAFGSLVL